jgi:N-acetylglucosaminyldiphosphoundecaprenol N-acetyl-beta-D-mannosaminyltransferase
VTEEDVLEFAATRLASRRPAQFVTVNAEFVVKAQHDPLFRDVLHGADLATPDGAGVVWAMRRQGRGVPRRVGGSDLIWSLSKVAAGGGYRIFLLGAPEGVAAAAARRLTEVIPELQVAGVHAGSPAMAEESAIVDSIRASRADLLFVAFGAPQQDLWVARNLARSGAVIGMGVGGTFDYVAGAARRAPVWMQDHALDWLWRLVQQPWRWRRMLALPIFAARIVREGTRAKGDGGR